MVNTKLPFYVHVAGIINENLIREEVNEWVLLTNIPKGLAINFGMWN